MITLREQIRALRRERCKCCRRYLERCKNNQPAEPKRGRGLPREEERETYTGISGIMFDDDGFVLPRFREHVARLRKQPQMSDIGEVMHMAQSRRED